MSTREPDEAELPIHFPDLVDVTLRLAGEVLPTLRRIQGQQKGEIQPLDISLMIAPAFGFAATLVLKFFEGFASELGKKAAGRLASVVSGASNTSGANATAAKLVDLGRTIDETRVSLPTRNGLLGMTGKDHMCSYDLRYCTSTFSTF